MPSPHCTHTHAFDRTSWQFHVNGRTFSMIQLHSVAASVKHTNTQSPAARCTNSSIRWNRKKPTFWIVNHRCENCAKFNWKSWYRFRAALHSMNSESLLSFYAIRSNRSGSLATMQLRLVSLTTNTNANWTIPLCECVCVCMNHADEISKFSEKNPQNIHRCDVNSIEMDNFPHFKWHLIRWMGDFMWIFGAFWDFGKVCCANDESCDWNHTTRTHQTFLVQTYTCFAKKVMWMNEVM